MMLSVKLLSTIIMLPFTLRMIGFLTCGKSLSLLLNLYQTYETLWTCSRKWVVDFMHGKLNLYYVTIQMIGAIDEIMNESVLDVRCWVCLSPENWIEYLIYCLYYWSCQQEHWILESFFQVCFFPRLPFIYIYLTYNLAWKMLSRLSWCS